MLGFAIVLDQLFYILAILVSLVLIKRKFLMWRTSRERNELYTLVMIVMFLIANVFSLDVMGESYGNVFVSFIALMLGLTITVQLYVRSEIFDGNYGVFLLYTILPLIVSCMVVICVIQGVSTYIDSLFPKTFVELIYLSTLPCYAIFILSLHLKNYLRVCEDCEWGSAPLVFRFIGCISALTFMLGKLVLFLASFAGLEILTLFMMYLLALIYAFVIVCVGVAYAPPETSIVISTHAAWSKARQYIILRNLNPTLQQVRQFHNSVYHQDDESDINHAIISAISEIMDFKRMYQWANNLDPSELDSVPDDAQRLRSNESARLFEKLDVIDDSRSDDYVGLAYEYSYSIKI